MPRWINRIALAVSITQLCSSAIADNAVGQLRDVRYAISDGGLGVFQSGETQWMVACIEHACSAASGHIVLQLDESGLSLETDLTGAIALWQNRTAQPLPKGQPLAVFEKATLLSAGDLVVTDPTAASIEQPVRLSTEGIDVVILFMEMWQKRQETETINSYMAVADGQLTTTPAQLVPFTKPQIEFAIRAQTVSD